MYERSMIGTGAIVFAVWGYVIATARPDRRMGAQVTINPDLLAAILGESPQDVQRAIDFLCSPDPKSTSKDEGGRRLIKLGEFDYRVVNYAKYRAIRDEERRREQNRMAQEKFREKQKGVKRGPPLPGEVEFERLIAEGRDEEAQNLLDNQPGIPSGAQ